MSKKYSLKFIKLSKYASSLVSNAKDEINCYVTGMFEDIKEKCSTCMLHDNMDLSRLMVHFSTG